jgi:DNA-binding MarR family transcriptional regulator
MSRPRRPAPASDPAARRLLEQHSAWDQVGYVLWHATLRWKRELAAALRPLDLTHAQFHVLCSTWWLQRQGGDPTQKELADHCGLEPMTVSKVARALEERGLMRRVIDREDSRALRLSLTALGLARAEAAIVAVDELESKYLLGRVGDRDDFLASLRLIAGRDEHGVDIDPAAAT